MEANAREQYNQMAAMYDRVWSRYISRSLSFLKDWAQLDPLYIVLVLGGINKAAFQLHNGLPL